LDMLNIKSVQTRSMSVCQWRLNEVDREGMPEENVVGLCQRKCGEFWPFLRGCSGLESTENENQRRAGC